MGLLCNFWALGQVRKVTEILVHDRPQWAIRNELKGNPAAGFSRWSVPAPTQGMGHFDWEKPLLAAIQDP